MCGIIGLALRGAKRISPDAVESLLNSIAHRGPDDFGILGYSRGEVRRGREWEDSETEVLLLHRRLSILDLSPGGWQPMSSRDGRFHVIFNGEIYNYREIRSELESLGIEFRSESDTEVLLESLVRWGTDALEKFVGMFALALLDIGERKITLARDFFGIKPLYFKFNESGIAFSSEVKPLLDLLGSVRKPNPDSLYQYLRHGQSDFGVDTLFSNVFQVPSGHYLEYWLDSRETPAISRYWQVDPRSVTDLSYEEATSKVRELFLESVDLHLRSDVPLGAALSGGIDSSAIVMAMRHLRGNSIDIHTISYIADSTELSEERWIDDIGRAAGATMHKIQPGPQELLEDLDKLIYQHELPFGSTSVYAQYRVFKAAKAAGLTVMLSGQGADEVLAGYVSYYAARLASLLKQQKWSEAITFGRQVARIRGSEVVNTLLRSGSYLAPAQLEGISRRIIGEDHFTPWMNRKWFIEKGVTPAFEWRPASKQVLKEHLHHSLFSSTLPSLLRYEDRNSMAHSIESRVPFLTPRLVTFLLSLPESYLILPNGTTKGIFRQAMRGIVPDNVLDRTDKIGFVTPEHKWLGTLTPWVETVMNGDSASRMDSLDVNELQESWKKMLSGKHLDFRLWRVINCIKWAEMFDVREI